MLAQSARNNLIRRSTAPVLLVLCGVFLPYLFGTDVYHLGQLTATLSLIMVAMGLNLVLGYAGQLFLGPGALFAVGGYTAGYFSEHYSAMQSLPMMCLTAVIGSVVVAAIVAIPTLRISGFYFALITLYMAIAIPTIVSQLNFVGGADGISLLGVISFHQHPSGLALYEWGIVIIAALAGYTLLVVHSRVGRRLVAIRCSDQLAAAVAVPPYWSKLLAFLIAAVPAGIGGAYFVYSQQFISPGAISSDLTIYVLAGVVIGGSGTVIGPIIGTGMILGGQELFGSVHQYQGLLVAGFLIAVALVAPRGIVGIGSRVWDKVFGVQETKGETPGGVDDTALSGMEDLARRAISTLSPKEDLPGLRLSGVSKAYGGVQAVSEVDLEVRPGTIHALVGPNGSGKTTLINLISGFSRPDSGQVWLGDTELTGRAAYSITKSGVARTFQTPQLALDSAVHENVLLGSDRLSKGTLLGGVLRSPRSRREARTASDRAIRAIEGLRIGATVGSPAGSLSHGTQRLVELARTVALDPTLLMLDEPAAGLSAAETKVLQATIRELAVSGLGILLVEHNLPMAFGVADWVTVLAEGRVIASGTPGDVSKDPEVVRVYLGRRKDDYNQSARIGTDVS
jgi:branched-chain amino acid transport system permease protein